MDDLVRQARQYLQSEIAFGLSEVPAARMRTPASADKAKALEVLFDQYKDCQMCSLGQSRTRLVFGDGNPEARLMFIGEAPGFEEDKQGLPFVGAAGQLLTKIIEAMKLTRKDVYIANCLKCRPPQNRNPLPEEIATCNPILAKQIDIIQPQIICALGKFAAQALLKTEEPISRLRGRFFDWAPGIKLMPTFHPAYLLRNPEDKKFVWEDMRKIMGELNIK